MQSPCQPDSNSGRRFLISRLWAPVFMMLTVSLFSGSAGVQMGDWSFVGIDKLGHFVIFGLLGVAWVRYLEPMGLGKLKTGLWSTGLSTAFGLFDELHQYLNPLRTFEWADLMADFLGAASGSLLFLTVPFLRALAEFNIGKFGCLRSSSS